MMEPDAVAVEGLRDEQDVPEPILEIGDVDKSVQEQVEQLEGLEKNSHMPFPNPNLDDENQAAQTEEETEEESEGDLTDVSSTSSDSMPDLLTGSSDEETEEDTDDEEDIEEVEFGEHGLRLLKFHPNCVDAVVLSNSNRSARQRVEPMVKGYVCTQRPLYNEERYEITIDKQKECNTESGVSIDHPSFTYFNNADFCLGVTTCDPDTMRFPEINLSRTIIITGPYVLIDGMIDRINRSFNFNRIKCGDRIGLIRTKNGQLYCTYNGEERGLIAEYVEPKFWGIVGLFGATFKVTINDHTETCLTPHLQTAITQGPGTTREDELQFQLCSDSTVAIHDTRRTVVRVQANAVFSSGIVLTNRVLRPHELFRIRIDCIIGKWSGGLEFGVTRHAPSSIPGSYRLRNIRSQTWAICGEDFYINGNLHIKNYIPNLNLLKEGDTVSVGRSNHGVLHFFLNNIDQGPAAFNVPADLFGILDLHGRMSTATVLEGRRRFYLGEIPPSFYNPDILDQWFHNGHTSHGLLSVDFKTATRMDGLRHLPTTLFFSWRALYVDELFEIMIKAKLDTNDRMIPTFRMGVTPLDPNYPQAQGIDFEGGTIEHAYFLNRDILVRDQHVAQAKYVLNLNTLKLNDRVGVLFRKDGHVHYFLNGTDMGRAFYTPHHHLFAFIDLCGTVSQVTVLQNMTVAKTCIEYERSVHRNDIDYYKPIYQFSELHEVNSVLYCNQSIASRKNIHSLSPTMVFSRTHLHIDRPMAVRIRGVTSASIGAFGMGLTTVNLFHEDFPFTNLQSLPYFTKYIQGNYTRFRRPNGLNMDTPIIFPEVQANDIITLARTKDQRVNFYVNKVLIDVSFCSIPEESYVVFELGGNITSIEFVTCSDFCTYSDPNKDSTVFSYTPAPESSLSTLHGVNRQFSLVCGTDIHINSRRTTAERLRSGTGGLVIGQNPLFRGQSFTVIVNKIHRDTVLSPSLGVGAITKIKGVNSGSHACNITSDCWIINERFKNINGEKTGTTEGHPLKVIRQDTLITVNFSCTNNLYVMIDNQFVIHVGRPDSDISCVYPIFDIYGAVSKISVVGRKIVTPLDAPLASLNIEYPNLTNDGAIEMAIEVEARAHELGMNEVYPLFVTAPVSYVPVILGIDRPVEKPVTLYNVLRLMDRLDLPDAERAAWEMALNCEHIISTMKYWRDLWPCLVHTRDPWYLSCECKGCESIVNELNGVPGNLHIYCETQKIKWFVSRDIADQLLNDGPLPPMFPFIGVPNPREFLGENQMNMPAAVRDALNAVARGEFHGYPINELQRDIEEAMAGAMRAIELNDADEDDLDDDLDDDEDYGDPTLAKINAFINEMEEELLMMEENREEILIDGLPSHIYIKDYLPYYFAIITDDDMNLV